MIYAVLFEDDESFSNKRAEHMDEHLSFLENNANNILSAGPLKNASDGSPAGGLWLVDAQDAKDVQSIIEVDPFWPTGLRKSVNICEWKQVFTDGKRQI